MSRPKSCSRAPAIAFPSSRVTSRSAEPFGPDSAGPVSKRNEPVRDGLDEARRPTDEHARVVRSRKRDLAEQVDIDAAVVPVPAWRLLPRQRVNHFDPELIQLFAVDHVV